MEKSISVSAVKGYRSTVSTTLRFVGNYEPSWDNLLGAVIRNMSVERPRRVSHSPRWDLSVVLRALHSPPFEPLANADLKSLTLKTVFLVALATAQRRSEIHAIAFDRVFFNEGGEAILGSVPGFMATNQAALTSRRPVVIPSLSRTVSRDLPDRMLCPVRLFIGTPKP